MRNKKSWGISLTKNVLIPVNTDTKRGTYKALAYKAFRKFSTRDEAREFKRGDGRALSIINLSSGYVSR